MLSAARWFVLVAGLGAVAGVAAEPFGLECTSQSLLDLYLGSRYPHESDTSQVVVDPEARSVLINDLKPDEVSFTATRIKFHLRFHLGQILHSWEIDRNTGRMEEIVRDDSDKVIRDVMYGCELTAPRLASSGPSAAVDASAEPFRLVCTDGPDESRTLEVVVDTEAQAVLVDAVSAVAVSIAATKIKFALSVRVPHNYSVNPPPPKTKWWEIDRRTGLMNFTFHDSYGSVLEVATYECEKAGPRF